MSDELHDAARKIAARDPMVNIARETFTCANGHPVDAFAPVVCSTPECDAMIVYQPLAIGLAMDRILVEVKLYAEKMVRERDQNVRTYGADLLQILQGDAG